jgi:hypothetical protein
MNSKPPIGIDSLAELGCRQRLAIAALIVCQLTVAGCNSQPPRPAPQTYPVTGKVTSPSGQSLVGARIEFKPKDNQWELAARGVVEADGRFSLQIPFIDRQIPGATEGPHRASLTMALGQKHDGTGGDYIPIPGEFIVKPGENNFEITLPGRK